MYRDNGNPNICYAVGDNVADTLGNTDETRQPTTGVAEKITFLAIAGTADGINLIPAAGGGMILIGSTDERAADSTTRAMGLVIENDMPLNKPGTTDKCYPLGVQVNA